MHISLFLNPLEELVVDDDGDIFNNIVLATVLTRSRRTSLTERKVLKENICQNSPLGKNDDIQYHNQFIFHRHLVVFCNNIISLLTTFEFFVITKTPS